jgi:hypothetical protein
MERKDNDDNDPVIKEIPVILSQELTSQLCLLQYPLRPPWRPYEPQNLQEVYFFYEEKQSIQNCVCYFMTKNFLKKIFLQIRFKPTRQLLEIDYNIPKLEDKKNEDMVVSLCETKENSLGDSFTQKFVLRSSTVPLKTNYLIGIYRGCKYLF